MTKEDKEIWDIVTESRIKVLKERNPDYEEILSLLEDYSKFWENEKDSKITLELIVDNICIFCKGLFAIFGASFMVVFVISCIKSLLA